MKITMVDTIGLSIPYGQYTILNSALFRPSFNKIDPKDTDEWIQFLKEYKGLKKYSLNPKQEYKTQGLTYPNVTIYETYKSIGGYQCNLKPHVSIPKMILGNSVEEINNSHYQEAVATLQNRLKDMGVYVYENAIHEAIVTTLHYCMNILMPTEADARRFLHALSRMTMDNRYEPHTRDYANGGKAVRFHTKVFEFISYLKYYDFLETGVDRIDKKATLQEKSIAKKLFKVRNMPSLIRLETRLNGKPTIRKHLRTITGIDKPRWTFKEVFNENISRKVTQYYWHKLIGNPMNKLMLTEVSRDNLHRKLTETFSSVPQRTIDATVGMIDRLNAQGALNYKEELLKNYSRSKWYKDQEKIVEFLEKNNININSDLLEFVESAVNQKPLQLGLPI